MSDFPIEQQEQSSEISQAKQAKYRISPVQLTQNTGKVIERFDLFLKRGRRIQDPHVRTELWDAFKFGQEVMATLRLPAEHKYYLALAAIDVAITEICTACDCDYGERTKARLRKGSKALSTAIEDFKLLAAEINNDPNILMWIDYDAWAFENVRHLTELTASVDLFLSSISRDGVKRRFEMLGKWVIDQKFDDETASLAGALKTKGDGSAYSKSLAVDYVIEHGGYIVRQKKYSQPLTPDHYVEIAGLLLQALDAKENRDQREQAAYNKLSSFYQVLAPRTGERRINRKECADYMRRAASLGMWEQAL